MSSSTVKRVLAVGLVVVAGAGYWFWQSSAPPAAEPVAVAVAPPSPDNMVSAAIEPAIRYPVPPPPVDEAVPPLPALPAAPPPELESSDGLVVEALARLFGKGGLGEMLIVKDFVRRVVVTVDNLPGEQLPWGRSPLQRADGGFLVDGSGDGMTVASANAARYLPYVKLAEAVDAARLVAAYSRLYPLFQAAYDELGYPGAYFNDRLVAVIDHMLAAPEVDAPIRLVQPKVRYRFADPELERLSAGHKIMLRMGTDNARRVKAKLSDVRRRLASAAPSR